MSTSGVQLRLSASSLRSIVIIVVASAQAAGLRVDRYLAGFAVQESGHLHVSSVAGDHDVGPSVRLQFRFHLLGSDRTIACDEHRSWLLRSRNHETGASDQQRTGDETYDNSSHSALLHG